MLNFDKKDTTIVKESISELVNEILSDETKIKKIAILVSVFSRFEGASRVVEQQAFELSMNNCSVTVFTFVADIVPDNYRVDIINPLVPLNNYFLNKIYRALFPINLIKVFMLIPKLKEFDVIILHHATLANLAYLSKKLYGTKVIFYNHHIGEEEPVIVFTLSGFAERVYSKIAWPIYWKLIKKFDNVVSVSKYSRNILYEKKGIDSTVIYNKIDTGRFKDGLDNKRIRSRYQINDDPLILFVGRIIPYKGIHLLIDSFKLVKSKIPTVKLLIVGKHYDKDYSEQLIKMADNSIYFVGKVSDEELPYYYAACDVYATCSVIEGFNLPLVEAQACGKPVVAFDIGAHKEVVKKGVLVREYDIECFSYWIEKILKKEEYNALE